jgi:hypothetical protein
LHNYHFISDIAANTHICEGMITCCLIPGRKIWPHVGWLISSQELSRPDRG